MWHCSALRVWWQERAHRSPFSLWLSLRLPQPINLRHHPLCTTEVTQSKLLWSHTNTVAYNDSVNENVCGNLLTAQGLSPISSSFSLTSLDSLLFCDRTSLYLGNIAQKCKCTYTFLGLPCVFTLICKLLFLTSLHELRELYRLSPQFYVILTDHITCAGINALLYTRSSTTLYQPTAVWIGPSGKRSQQTHHLAPPMKLWYGWYMYPVLILYKPGRA